MKEQFEFSLGLWELTFRIAFLLFKLLSLSFIQLIRCILQWNGFSAQFQMNTCLLNLSYNACMFPYIYIYICLFYILDLSKFERRVLKLASIISICQLPFEIVKYLLTFWIWFFKWKTGINDSYILSNNFYQ